MSAFKFVILVPKFILFSIFDAKYNQTSKAFLLSNIWYQNTENWNEKIN